MWKDFILRLPGEHYNEGCLVDMFGFFQALPAHWPPSIKSQHEDVSKLHLYAIVAHNISGMLSCSAKVIFL